MVESLCDRLGYEFRNRALLLNALCHASFCNEQARLGLNNNERLEFLGDAVLELIVSHMLMESYKEAEEGMLSRYRAALVDETGLHQVAKEIELGEYIFLGKGEESSGGREKPSILADAVEALIGAVYLDGGFEAARTVVVKLFSSHVEELGRKEVIHDFKSLLQELTQQRYKTVPDYRLVEEWGPPHDKVFRVSLRIRGEVVSHGEGKSKKEAEQKAAEVAYLSMRKG
ncbi:MAG: ribonuclease III [Deltaproteobacteria bacterium]|nr:MAG: ribonuclease III [Deltaproteobacteria bacterium]RLB78511.1 MAG: ribonuclease III [Deltaproteobacteria bacterium]